MIKTILNFVPQSKIPPILTSNKSLPRLYLEATADRLNSLTYPLKDRVKELETILYRYSNCTPVFRFLAERLNSKRFGHVLLINALEHRQHGVAKFLLSVRQIDPSLNNSEALDMAILVGNLELVKFILKDKRVDPSNAIFFAASQGHLKVVKFLIHEEMPDPSLNENVAILHAASAGHVDIVRFLLLDKRVDPSSNNDLAVCRAEAHGHKQVVKLLLADPRVNHETHRRHASNLHIRRIMDQSPPRRLRRRQRSDNQLDQLLRDLTE